MAIINFNLWETENQSKYHISSNNIKWNKIDRSIQRKIYKDYGLDNISDFEYKFNFQIDEIKSSTKAQRVLINLLICRKELDNSGDQLCLYAAQNGIEQNTFLLTFFQRVEGVNVKPVLYSDFIFQIKTKYYVRIVKNNKQYRLRIYAEENNKLLLYDSGLKFWIDIKYRFLIICNGANRNVDINDYSSGEFSDLIIIQKYGIKAFISTSDSTNPLIEIIKGSLLELDIEPLYIDNYSKGSLLDTIHNFIKSSDIFISLLDDNNFNMYYELGYASALRKNLLPILSSWDFIMPTNLRNNLYLVYDEDHLDEFKPLFKNWTNRIKTEIINKRDKNE